MNGVGPDAGNVVWGVYGITGVTSERTGVTRWVVRWRVNGVARKRTFDAKGHARSFHDQLQRARLSHWSADSQGWPLDPAVHQSAISAQTQASHPHPTDAGLIPPGPGYGYGVPPTAYAAPMMTFADYCTTVWWPTIGPTFGDKNMLGHRKNMRTAIELLVYRDNDPRCATPGINPGDSILLPHLRADDLRLALVTRRGINDRTAAANQRRLEEALTAGIHDIQLAEEIAAPATVRAFFITLSMIIKAASRSGHTIGDPLDGVSALAPAPRNRGVATRVLPSLQDVFDLADAIATIGPPLNGRPTGERYRALILTAGTLGPRPGELVAHRPEWIEFADPTLVHFAATEAAVYDTETNLAGRRTRSLKHRDEDELRTVPAIPEVTEALRLHLDRGYHGNDRTFTSPTGRGRLDWGNLTEPYWRPTCEAVFAGTAKEALAAMPPKTLRKAAVTWWQEQGIPPTLAAEWAGHSVAVAQAHYTGRSNSTYAREVDQLRRHPRE